MCHRRTLAQNSVHTLSYLHWSGSIIRGITSEIVLWDHSKYRKNALLTVVFGMWINLSGDVRDFILSTKVHLRPGTSFQVWMFVEGMLVT